MDAQQREPRRAGNTELNFEHCHPLDSSWSHSFIELSVRNFSSMDFIAKDQAFHFNRQVEELFLSVEVTMNRQSFIFGSLVIKAPFYPLKGRIWKKMEHGPSNPTIPITEGL